MAARSSIRVPMGPRSHLGAWVVRKMADPTARGNPMTNAIALVIRVPETNGTTP
jgi:hypothetical protein